MKQTRNNDANTTADYIAAMAALDSITRMNILKASTRIKVTSKQPVTMKLMWGKQKRNKATAPGVVEHMEWTPDVRRAVNAMGGLVMRFIELSS